MRRRPKFLVRQSTLTTNDMFGESALFDKDNIRAVTVRADTIVDVQVLCRDTFYDLLAEHEDLHWILKKLANRRIDNFVRDHMRYVQAVIRQ